MRENKRILSQSWYVREHKVIQSQPVNCSLLTTIKKAPVIVGFVKSPDLELKKERRLVTVIIDI